MNWTARLALAAVLSMPGGPLRGAGQGARFGARDPKTCASRKAPVQGGPTREQALKYFVCSIEGAGENTLVLVSDVKLEVATRSRAVNLQTDDMDGIDTGRRVYDINGSFTEYECATLGGESKQGQNCKARRQRRAKGICYHEWGGDWRCMMSDNAAQDWERTGVAPPQ